MEVLSNAEQHFLGYKSIAAIENGFKKMIRKEPLFWMWAVETCRISLFDKDALVTAEPENGKRAYPPTSEGWRKPIQLCTAGGGVYP